MLEGAIEQAKIPSALAEIARSTDDPLPPLTRRERHYLSLRRFVDDLAEQMQTHSFIPWSTNTSSLAPTVFTHEPSVVTVAVS